MQIPIADLFIQKQPNPPKSDAKLFSLYIDTQTSNLSKNPHLGYGLYKGGRHFIFICTKGRH